MEFGNLDFTIGSVNPSGVGTTIYRIPKDAIAAWPTIANDMSGTGAISTLSTYTGDFTLKTGKHWDTIYTTQGKGKGSYEPVGEVDCKMFNNKLSVSYPKINAESLAFAKFAVNGDFVYIFKQDGKYHVIGHPDYRVTTGPSGDTGDQAGSAKGTTIEIEAPDVTPLPIYVGDIVLADGTLDCSTGEFTPASD